MCIMRKRLKMKNTKYIPTLVNFVSKAKDFKSIIFTLDRIEKISKKHLTLLSLQHNGALRSLLSHKFSKL